MDGSATRWKRDKSNKKVNDMCFFDRSRTKITWMVNVYVWLRYRYRYKHDTTTLFLYPLNENILTGVTLVVVLDGRISNKMEERQI
jgi:hypothetical protein